MSWADGIGVSIFEKRLPEGLCGIYIDSQRTIIIDPTLNPTQRKCTLAHELVHAKYRDDLRYDTRGYCERRARRETARWLVRYEDYVAAERIYEGNRFLMSNELEVTLLVLEDFTRFLLAGRTRV